MSGLIFERDDLSEFLDGRTIAPFGKSGLTLNLWLWSQEAMSHEFLETCHDFVQWILPTNEKSKFSPTAPVLKASDAYLSKYSHPHRLDTIVMSSILMLSFWGKRVGLQDVVKNNGPMIVNSENSGKAFKNLAKNPHNIKRMTRMVKCLRLFGLNIFAKSVLDVVNDLVLSLRITPMERVLIQQKDGHSLEMANKFFAEEFILLSSLLKDEETTSTELKYYAQIGGDKSIINSYCATVISTMWA